MVESETATSFPRRRRRRPRNTSTPNEAVLAMLDLRVTVEEEVLDCTDILALLAIMFC